MSLVPVIRKWISNRWAFLVWDAFSATGGLMDLPLPTCLWDTAAFATPGVHLNTRSRESCERSRRFQWVRDSRRFPTVFRLDLPGVSRARDNADEHLALLGEVVQQGSFYQELRSLGRWKSIFFFFQVWRTSLTHVDCLE